MQKCSVGRSPRRSDGSRPSTVTVMTLSAFADVHKLMHHRRNIARDVQALRCDLAGRYVAILLAGAARGDDEVR